MLNHITIHGRLTADPELKQTQSGVSVCKISPLPLTVLIQRVRTKSPTFSPLFVGEV